MSRLSDPMSSEYDEGPAQTGQQVRRSLDGKFVCPFCGSVNTNTDEACPKCGMENTPATRNSTRARIGPWYVLQKRNPSAPGMKFDTLLRFVQKGRVNARTIVRGPTTSQLWRFAATVKGLSREFGLCYNCGGDIDRTAVLCPHCARNQQPPADPDALLETKVPAPRNEPESNGEELGGADLSDATIAGEVARAAASPPPSPFSTTGTVKPPAPKPAPQPAAENPVTAQMRREAQERKEIEEARQKREAQREADRRDPNKHVPTLNAAELATAFQLGITPSAMGRPRHRRSHKKIWVFVTILLLIGVGVLAYFQLPSFQQFCNDTYAAAAAKVQGLTHKPDKSDPNVSKGVDAMTSKLSEKNAPKTEVKPAVPDIRPEPKPEPKVEIKPEPKPEPTVQVKPEPKPEVKVEAPVVVPPPPAPKPKLTEDQAADKVRTLWRQAFTCEASGDWSGAVAAYEEIKTLQPSVWPAGLDLRLNDAKSHLR